jgi:hypothetical protein
VSKRHQSSRRKTYGRRQHELRERSTRQRSRELLESPRDVIRGGSQADGYGMFDFEFGRPNLRFALGD